MLETKTDIFVALSKDAPLARAIVVESDETTTTIEFDDPCRPTVGDSIEIYYHLGGQRVRATATIQAFLRSQPKSAFRLTEWSTPEPSEGRTVARVVPGLDVPKILLEGKPAQLVNLSFEGLGTFSSEQFAKDAIVEVVLEFEGKEARGRASVRSAVALQDGRSRYGLEVLKGEHSLRSHLQRVVAEIQRRQARRAKAFRQ